MSDIVAGKTTHIQEVINNHLMFPLLDVLGVCQSFGCLKEAIWAISHLMFGVALPYPVVDRQTVLRMFSSIPFYNLRNYVIEEIIVKSLRDFISHDPSVQNILPDSRLNPC